ncbi:MAG: ferredoxin [Leptospiraceae bacterium]|nr:ferredoxin [Leptospiraceae bacterium]
MSSEQNRLRTGKGGLFRIQYNRRRCIGCGLCASIAPDRWIMNEKDGKAVLLHGRGRGHIFQSRVAETERPREAQECPPRAISVQELPG